MVMENSYMPTVMKKKVSMITIYTLVHYQANCSDVIPVKKDRFKKGETEDQRPSRFGRYQVSHKSQKPICKMPQIFSLEQPLKTPLLDSKTFSLIIKVNSTNQPYRQGEKRIILNIHYLEHYPLLGNLKSILKDSMQHLGLLEDRSGNRLISLGPNLWNHYQNTTKIQNKIENNFHQA
jgi:hypothetical protein